MSKAKQKASKWMSKYIRLRDALDYCKKMRIDISEVNDWQDLPCACCTCSKIIRIGSGDAGHCFSRGSGGQSGVYFDERNLALQCRPCNRFHQGRQLEFAEHIIAKYGQKVIDELRVKDKIPQDYSSMKMRATEIYFNQRFEELKDGKIV